VEGHRCRQQEAGGTHPLKRGFADSGQRIPGFAAGGAARADRSPVTKNPISPRFGRSTQKRDRVLVRTLDAPRLAEVPRGTAPGRRSCAHARQHISVQSGIPVRLGGNPFAATKRVFAPAGEPPISESTARLPRRLVMCTVRGNGPEALHRSRREQVTAASGGLRGRATPDRVLATTDHSRVQVNHPPDWRTIGAQLVARHAGVAWGSEPAAHREEHTGLVLSPLFSCESVAHSQTRRPIAERRRPPPGEAKVLRNQYQYDMSNWSERSDNSKETAHVREQGDANLLSAPSAKES
jgi:hypothetical protein